MLPVETGRGRWRRPRTSLLLALLLGLAGAASVVASPFVVTSGETLEGAGRLGPVLLPHGMLLPVVALVRASYRLPLRSQELYVFDVGTARLLPLPESSLSRSRLLCLATDSRGRDVAAHPFFVRLEPQTSLEDWLRQPDHLLFHSDVPPLADCDAGFRPPALVFADGFENGAASGWSVIQP